MQDIRQSINYAKYLEAQGWIIERTNKTNYFIKKIPIIGSIIKIQRPEKVDKKTIDLLSDRYKPFKIIIEPKSQHQVPIIKNLGFKQSKNPFLPTKTIHIDLSQSVKQITASFSKNTRYALRRGERIKILSHTSNSGIKKMHKAWKKSVNFNRFVPSLDSLINLQKCFASSHSLFLTSHNIKKEIIGGAVFTRSDKDFSYYWYGFTNKEGRSSLSQHSLLYQGILWAKKNGCKVFDLEGIYDQRFPNKSWLGFSHFKKGFGGNEITYPGCFEKKFFRFKITS